MNRCLPGGVMSMRHQGHRRVLVSLLVVLLGFAAPCPARAAGKEMVIGFLGDATSLNPLVATDGQSYIAEWPMFDSLLELDQNLNVRPLLAESWEVSRDGLTYTFKLKKGVRWHDGKPFTARDVAFTFYAVLDPKVTTPHRAYFDALLGFPELTNKYNPKRPEDLAQKPIDVLDDYTVRFRLRYPYGAFLAVLVNPRAGIIPEHLLKGVDLNTAEFNRKPVGTGPFRFVEWRRGERLVMAANAQYHGGRPALDRLIYRVIPDAVVLLQELRAGGVDFIESPPLTEVARLKQTQGLRVLVAGHGAVSALELGLRPIREGLSVRSRPGEGVACRGGVEARPRWRPRQGRQALELFAPPRPGQSGGEGHRGRPAGISQERRRRGATRAARLAHVRQEAVRVGLRGDLRRMDQLPRSRSLCLYDLAFEPVERAQLRPLQEPEGGRGPRGGATRGQSGRAQAPLRGVLEALDGRRSVCVPVLPPAGLCHATRIRGPRSHPDLRRHLSIAQIRALDGQMSGPPRWTMHRR